MELPHVAHEDVPAVPSRNRIGAAAAPFEILAVAAAPLPGVGQVEHGPHAAFAHLGEQEVEPVERAVVVDARGGLEDGFDLRDDPFAALRTDQHPQVVDARRVHAVEFAAEPCAVAAGTFGGEQGAVPEIGADEVGGHVVGAGEAALLDAGETGRFQRVAGRESEHQQTGDRQEQGFHAQFGLGNG